MNLEQTATALTEQFPGRKLVELDRAEKRLERFGRFAFGGFCLMIAIAILAIIYTIATKMIWSGENPWAGSLFVAFIVFAGLTLAYVVFKEDLKEKRKAMSKFPAGTDPIPEPDTSKLLNEPAAATVGSIIEDTTDLLPVEERIRKL